MDPVLASQLARDLERTLAALAHGERLLAGIDQVAAAVALRDGPRYSPLLATALVSTERVQQALLTSSAVGPGRPTAGAPSDRSPGGGDTPDPSPGLPPDTSAR